MEPLRVNRRLTCILAADAVGYSRMMGEDELGTVRILAAHRAVIDGIIAFHEGRIVGTAGDSVLAEFGSAVEAVRCAVEIQEALKTRNEALPEDHRLHFRVGVNLGDVVVKGEDLLGDGVNVAARLESIAEPGGVCIASSVYDQITGKLDLSFLDIGEQNLKNISRPIRVYRISGTGAPVRPVKAPQQWSRKRVAWAIGATALLGVSLLGAAWYGGWLGGEFPHAPSERTQAAAEDAKRPTEAAAVSEAKLRAESEAELVRARAEAEAAAMRTKAEADAAAMRAKASAEAVAVRAKAEADGARERAQREIEKVRGAAETDLAKAEQARRDAEAKVAELTARSAAPMPPTPVSAPQPSPAPSASAATTAAATSRYDGDWEVTLNCAAFQEIPEGTFHWRTTVRGGEFVLERGMPERPGYSRVSGRPTDDGNLVLTGMSISRSKANLGRTGSARFAGRLAGDRIDLNGRYGSRSCSITMVRAAS